MTEGKPGNILVLGKDNVKPARKGNYGRFIVENAEPATIDEIITKFGKNIFDGLNNDQNLKKIKRDKDFTKKTEIISAWTKIKNWGEKEPSQVQFFNVEVDHASIIVSTNEFYFDKNENKKQIDMKAVKEVIKNAFGDTMKEFEGKFIKGLNKNKNSFDHEVLGSISGISGNLAIELRQTELR